MLNLEAKWSDLLNETVKQPGLILRAYTAFHSYSIGNQIAAMVQCQIRGIEPGPINTYPGWQQLNRQVMKGERGIWLCMPLTRKVKNANDEDETVITSFVWRPHWFVISQTIGDEYVIPATPTWDKERALANLQITQIKFDLTNGNVLGFARKREVAVSPLAPLPIKTLVHEMAHCMLHTSEADFNDSEQTPKSLREVEAEAVAMIMCESLKLPGVEYARGYIQSYLKAGEVIPERSAMRIFGCADRLLRAGRQE